ncbi:hypothetical protein [Cohnella cellulosilytica]|uniref:hypothetical protein n=1 Tax=Cohnella cellulosilytica TaxID=986710 RepID=UPI0036240C15
MKLVHQINLAFGLLLVVILGATAVMIHYVLLDHLIVAQKNEMKTLGASVATTLRTQAAPWALPAQSRISPPLRRRPSSLRRECKPSSRTRTATSSRERFRSSPS